MAWSASGSRPHAARSASTSSGTFHSCSSCSPLAAASVGGFFAMLGRKPYHVVTDDDSQGGGFKGSRVEGLCPTMQSESRQEHGMRARRLQTLEPLDPWTLEPFRVPRTYRGKLPRIG